MMESSIRVGDCYPLSISVVLRATGYLQKHFCFFIHFLQISIFKKSTLLWASFLQKKEGE